MCRLSSLLSQVGVARGRRMSRKPLPSGREAAFPEFAGLVPPAASVPCVSGEREQFTRWRHRRKIESDT